MVDKSRSIQKNLFGKAPKANPSDKKASIVETLPQTNEGGIRDKEKKMVAERRMKIQWPKKAKTNTLLKRKMRLDIWMAIIPMKSKKIWWLIMTKRRTKVVLTSPTPHKTSLLGINQTRQDML